MGRDQPLTGIPLMLAMIGISLCTFMQVLDLSIANVSIPYISGGLAVSVNQGTWVITSFAVGNAIGLPTSGFLASRFGSVRTLCSSIILFTFFSWFCGGSFTFAMLLIGRFLQGFVAGPLIPLGNSMLIQIFPKEKKNLALALWAMIAVVGPIAGPILGGYLTQDYSWSWIFYVNVPFGIISYLLVRTTLKKYETKPEKGSVDYFGFVLLVLGVGALQVLVDKGEQLDWFRSPVIQTLCVISIISLTYLVIWELQNKKPLLEFKLFKDRNFCLGTLVASIIYMMLFGAIIVTPLWLQDYMGYTALSAGLAVAPMGIFPLLAAPLIGYLMNRVSLRMLVGICLLSFASAAYFYSFFTTDVSFAYIALSRILLGVGIAFYLGPIISLSLAKIAPEKLSSASSLFHFFRIFAGGIGTSLSVALWNRRATHHHSNLASELTPFDQRETNILSKLQSLDLKREASLETLNVMVDKQSYMLASNDVYYLFSFLFLLMFITIFFFRRKKQELV